MAYKDVQKRNAYTQNFLKERYSRLVVNLENEKDKDILDHLAEIKARDDRTTVDYIRGLIRSDMADGGMTERTYKSIEQDVYKKVYRDFLDVAEEYFKGKEKNDEVHTDR